MLPFQLNEEWVSGYLGIIGGLLAFVIGVSALVLQLAVPSYLETLMRRRKMMRYTIGIMALYLIMALVLIWISPFSGGDGIISPEMTTVINIGMTITFIATVLYTYNQLHQINGSRIIDSLLSECKIDIHIKGMFDDTLDTLIDLGAQRNAGYEKTRVLNALKDLAHFVVKDYERYDGTHLKPILRGLEKVLVGGGVQGSRDNFIVAASTLRYIIQRLCQNEQYVDSADIEEAMRVCGLLGAAAASKFPESCAGEFLQTIQAAEIQRRKVFGLASGAARTIGVAALKCGEFSICVNALSMLLKWEAEPNEPFDCDNSAEMLGLTAHLWAVKGGGDKLVNYLLSGYADHFQPSLVECLDEAINYHFISGNLDTHVHLANLRDQLPIIAGT